MLAEDVCPPLAWLSAHTGGHLLKACHSAQLGPLPHPGREPLRAPAEGVVPGPCTHLTCTSLVARPACPNPRPCLVSLSIT